MIGKANSRRNRLLVKHWMQLRYLLVLAGTTVAGGVVYALVLSAIFRNKLRPDLAVSHSTLHGGDLWISLYPTVAMATLAMVAVMAGILFLLLKAFTVGVSRASAGIEEFYGGLAAGKGVPGGEGRIPIREFRALAERTTVMVEVFRRKWWGAGEMAADLAVVVDLLEGVTDPAKRILAVRECEKRIGSLVETCRPKA